MSKDLIGQRIKELRIALKESQSEFIKGLDITQPSLSQVEKNIISPSLELVIRVVRKYDIRYEWLIEGEPEGYLDNYVNWKKKKSSDYKFKDKKIQREVEEFDLVYKNTKFIRLAYKEFDNAYPILSDLSFQEIVLGDFLDKYFYKPMDEIAKEFEKEDFKKVTAVEFIEQRKQKIVIMLELAKAYKKVLPLLNKSFKAFSKVHPSPDS